MANRVSPFAALTGAEKQIKWLEYQSVKLPYIQSGVEDVLPPQEKRQEKIFSARATANMTRSSRG